MKILVTGSEGNIGRVLVPYLRGMGHDVFGVDIVQKFEEGFQTADITDGADMVNVFYTFKPEVVLHLAAMVSRVTCEKSPVTTIKTNVYGTENIIRLCSMVNARLVFLSTSEVYGNIGGELSETLTHLYPNNIYGLSKLIGEQLVQYEVKNGLKALIVRPFMLYDENETFGEHRSALIRFVDNLTRDNKIVVHKDSCRSWMHVSDAVVVLERLCHTEEFAIVNIGHPQVFETSEVAGMICKELNLIYEDYVIEEVLPSKMTLRKVPVLNKQRDLTGYECKVNLPEGIKRLIAKVKERR